MKTESKASIFRQTRQNSGRCQRVKKRKKKCKKEEYWKQQRLIYVIKIQRFFKLFLFSQHCCRSRLMLWFVPWHSGMGWKVNHRLLMVVKRFIFSTTRNSFFLRHKNFYLSAPKKKQVPKSIHTYAKFLILYYDDIENDSKMKEWSWQESLIRRRETQKIYTKNPLQS